MRKKSKKKEQHKGKATATHRFFGMVGKILYKCFGKARWYLSAFLIILAAETFIMMNFGLDNRVRGVKRDNRVLKETPIRDVLDFTVNEEGDAAVSLDTGEYGMMAFFRPETGETLYAGTGGLVVDLMGYEGSFAPSNFAMGDNGELYAVRTVYEDVMSSRNIVRESILQISGQYELKDEIYARDYDRPGGHRSTRFSRLHYADGVLTFAVIDQDRVYTCRYDAASGKLQQSREYPTDADGTYTVNVIPVDGAFLFLRSNGDVYLTEFDKPLGERICRFDPRSPEGAVPLFTQAVLSGGELYVYDEKEPSKVYALKDGMASEVLDLKKQSGYEEREIRYLDSCRLQDGQEVLVLCLADGLMFWTDGGIEEKDIRLKVKPTVWNHLWVFSDMVLTFLFWALVIHLFIRKKTLFYKRMLMTVPVFMLVIIVVTVKVYDYSNSQNNRNIRREMEIITRFGMKELEGYDFTGLLKADAHTGEEYRRLYEKIRSINTDRRKEWSRNYVFSVVYRTGETTAALLLDDDMVVMPMDKLEDIASEEEFLLYDASGKYYVSENLTAFMSDAATHNEISAFGKIVDAQECGRVYLKVSTDTRRFWYQRRQLIIGMALLAAIFIAILSFMIMIASFYITRAIKKAGAVVQKIAEGDFSAKVNYRSRDELGEICTQVNAMGKNLEELFEEKDKTEQFYYRFVPEQFRKLLGKEKFTDLTLGDSADRDLTVFFCDIRSFSINSEIMTAKENFEFVNVIYGIAGPIIRKNGGFVDTYIGDAVMALFEDAEDAVKSGIEIYREIVLNPQTAQKLGISDIHIGIGIHSGRARVGIVGESERLAGTVISDIVSLASRLETLTKQYGAAILVSKDTVDRLHTPEQFELHYLGRVQVAEKEEELPVYEVLDCLPEEERKDRITSTHAAETEDTV